MDSELKARLSEYKVVLKKFTCESHSIDDIMLIDNKIYCNDCGTKLTLVPAWIIGNANSDKSREVY